MSQELRHYVWPMSQILPIIFHPNVYGGKWQL